MRSAANGPMTAPVLNALLGYQRVFDSLPEAVAAARPYAEGGHENPDNAKLHLWLEEVPRPSDYAVMFHIQRLISNSSRVFDLGGNVGNLFYCFDRYLKFSPKLVWQVFELPGMIELGRRLASERRETRLQFTKRWEDAAGADLLLASGSLHYFAAPLAQMVAELAEKPAHIIINRTPLVDGPTKATVQDGGEFRAACVLYNKTEVMDGFEAIGYEIIDSWKSTEISLRRVGKPESSACPYTGMYFRLKQAI